MLLLTAAVVTTVLGAMLMTAALLRVHDRPGGLYDKIPRWWSKAMLWAAGVKLRVHGWENAGSGDPHIFAANHVSWFDVPALAAVLPRYKFVAKAELFKVPVFGGGIRAAGMIEIQRDNRKAAFGAYDLAAKSIQAGNSVVVYPEGTRGYDYRLRPFKKGPFVLAIAAEVPIVPVILHGTIEVLKRDSLWVHPGTIDIHLLEPVPTAGVGYDGRDELMAKVRRRMADAMRELYGVEPLRVSASRVPSGSELLSSETQPTETR
ncbi:MAG: lysophospholipid acyltransferase family protein [Gemmatimonadaceae bacterium]